MVGVKMLLFVMSIAYDIFLSFITFYMVHSIATHVVSQEKLQ